VADGIKFGSVVLGYSRISGSFGYHRTDVNLGDSSGWAPLRFAVRWGYGDVTWLPLGDERVEVDVRDLENEVRCRERG